MQEEEQRNKHGTTSVSLGWPFLHHVRAMAEHEGVSVAELLRSASAEYAIRHYSTDDFKNLVGEHIERKSRADVVRKTTRRAADV